MANPYLAPGAQRAARVNDLFGVVAARYDLINDLQSCGLHRLWKRRLVRMARVVPDDRALDLCCGTGDIALLLALRGARVTGLDFSEPMLELARKRAATGASEAPSAPGNPRFIRADALHTPFGDAQFEVVTIGYGLRNLASVEAGLREMHRVAKPGGRLLVLEFGKPANSWLRRFYFSYLRFWVPLFGKIFCGDAAAYRYILESLRDYPGQMGIAALMRELDCRNIRIINLLGGTMSINYGERRE